VASIDGTARDGPLAAMVAPFTTVRLPTPLRLTPPLRERHYVFPVSGDLGVADTFGAARSDESWHHGDDLFAPRGTPVLAVANGVIFSVGRQRLGGRRLWLRDRAGNEFYYAHLNAYSPLARDGELVRAGDVIGYVGNTGDAEHTPPHLHFEIHPASLLGLGYDGAVDPTSYLRAWQRRSVDGYSAAAAPELSSLARSSCAAGVP
jgi:murein DD-endopeptidase MepM/ murein hydrolase activator NlpD